MMGTSFLLGLFFGSVLTAGYFFWRYRRHEKLIWSVLEDEIIAPLMKTDSVRAKRLTQLIQAVLAKFYR